MPQDILFPVSVNLLACLNGKNHDDDKASEDQEAKNNGDCLQKWRSDLKLK